jgi:hypothetical protein
MHVGGCGYHQLCHFLHHQGYIPVSISELRHSITQIISQEHMFITVIMQSLSPLAESSLSSHEKNMQVVAEHALHEKLMSRTVTR